MVYSPTVRGMKRGLGPGQLWGPATRVQARGRLFPNGLAPPLGREFLTVDGSRLAAGSGLIESPPGDWDPSGTPREAALRTLRTRRSGDHEARNPPVRHPRWPRSRALDILHASEGVSALIYAGDRRRASVPWPERAPADALTGPVSTWAGDHSLGGLGSPRPANTSRIETSRGPDGLPSRRAAKPAAHGEFAAGVRGTRPPAGFGRLRAPEIKRDRLAAPLVCPSSLRRDGWSVSLAA